MCAIFFLTYLYLVVIVALWFVDVFGYDDMNDDDDCVVVASKVNLVVPPPAPQKEKKRRFPVELVGYRTRLFVVAPDAPTKKPRSEVPPLRRFGWAPVHHFWACSMDDGAEVELAVAATAITEATNNNINDDDDDDDDATVDDISNIITNNGDNDDDDVSLADDSGSEEDAEPPAADVIRPPTPRRSSRLAAIRAAANVDETNVPLLGSTYVKGRRRSARLLTIALQ